MLVTHRILLAHLGENATTPHDPVGAVASVDGDIVTTTSGKVADLRKTGTRCRSSDDDGAETILVYQIGEVALPEWLTPEEWLADTTTWKWVWGVGADPTWPESWQRGLARIGDTEARIIAVQLLKTKNFRNPFRQSMRDQIVAWFETPVDERKYPTSPLSFRQWGALRSVHTARDARCYDNSLYNNKGYRGAAPVAA